MSRFAKFAAEAILPSSTPVEDEQDKPSWKEWLATAGGLAALGGAGYLAYKHRDAIGSALNKAVGREPKPSTALRSGVLGGAVALAAPKVSSGLPGLRNGNLRSTGSAGEALAAGRANPEGLKGTPAGHLQAWQDDIHKAGALSSRPPKQKPGQSAPANPTPASEARNWKNLDLAAELRGVHGKVTGAPGSGDGFRKLLNNGSVEPLSFWQKAKAQLGRIITPSMPTLAPGLSRFSTDEMTRMHKAMLADPTGKTYGLENRIGAKHLENFLNVKPKGMSPYIRAPLGAGAAMIGDSAVNAMTGN